MKILNIADIRIDGDTQKRDELDTKKVHEFAELMADGIKFPPVTVFFDGINYWLSAGFHRYFAHKQNGLSEIECDEIEGTLSQAIWHSYGSNNHGTPHTLAERKRHALEILSHEEYSKHSERKISQHIGISRITLKKIKDLIGIEKAETVTYIKGGKEVERPISKKKEKTDGTNVPPKEDEVEKELLLTKEKVNELSDAVTDLALENTKLKDILSTKTPDLTEFEQIVALDTINELREQVRLLEMEVKTLRDSRDMFQSRNAELIRELKSLQRKK